MAEQRARAAGQDGGHQLAMLGEARMSNRIDAAVHDVQATGANAVAHCLHAEADPPQLPARDHTVLSGSDFRDRPVRWIEFPFHMNGKSIHRENSPPDHGPGPHALAAPGDPATMTPHAAASQAARLLD
jgi:hypothetical protein